MILADTSVWIDYFNGEANVHTDTLDDALVDGTVAIGDLILLEILQGFRNDKDYRRARATLTSLDQFELLGPDMAFHCADNYRALRKKGLTVRRTNDVVIATFCIKNKIPLLFSDRDFNPFVVHLKLRTVLSEYNF